MTFSLLEITPVAALVLFAVWGLLLVTTVGVWRFALFLTGNVPEGGFNPGTQHGSSAYWRLNRAHMNVVENLPAFAAIVLSGVALGVQSPEFSSLASIVLLARVVQTFIHVSSGAQIAILLRFAAYLVQVICMFGMAALVLQAAGLAIPV